MLPSIPGMISAHDLKIIFSNSTDWITVHQDINNLETEEFKNLGPFMQISFQIIPGQPIETQIVSDPDTGLVQYIKIRRKAQDLLLKPN